MKRYPRGVTVKSVDANHAEILTKARALGFDVVDTHVVGLGVMDAVIIRPSDSHAWKVEIKTDSGKLTEAEERYIRLSRVPVHILRSVDELLTLLGVG